MISGFSLGVVFEKYFVSIRLIRVDFHWTCHCIDGNVCGFNMGLLKWKKDVGLDIARKARRRGRIMMISLK
jgi:hypothetical protein